jgi:hypothetical protein
MAVSAEVADTLRSGIESCRRGDWNAGLRFLGQVAEKEEASGGLPGLFYSYLGYGIALRDRRIREGLKLCRHSIEVEFYQAENYLNLARTCLLANDRKRAVQAVRGGLKIDRNNLQLLALYKEMGIRSHPVLRFLDRAHPLNQLLGRLRHSLRGGP